MNGHGAKQSLDYLFKAPMTVKTAKTPTGKALKMRNLDGEALQLIRHEGKDKAQNPFSFNAEKIGSI